MLVRLFIFVLSGLNGADPYIDSFEHVKSWLTEITKHAAEGVHRLLIGNKSDLVERKVVAYSDAKVSCVLTFTHILPF